MKLAFYLAAATMIALALALLLWPLVRAGRRQGRPRGVFALALGVAFALPLAAAGLYLVVGTPVALDGVPRQDQMPGIDTALEQLRAHLAQQPKDIQAWQLLAQTYAALRRPADARDAYAKILELDADNAVALVGWAESDSLARDDHRLDGHARELLQRAVQDDPQNQRGLWLLGISDFQLGHYAEAAATWRKLQPLLSPGSTVAQAVAQQIAAADARVAGAPAAGGSSADAASSDGTPPGGDTQQAGDAQPAGPALQVQIALAPALKDKLGGDATVFVYARAEQGSPMPLAVARLDASALPAAVTLTDAMAMTPSLRLSSAPRVFVGARISRSGQAMAQAGDLEGDAGVVATDLRTPVKILIDKVHP